MGHPVTALIWECWRLSRRWYLWVLLVATAADLLLMSRAATVARNMPPPLRIDLTVAYALLGQVAFMMNFTLAIFTTLLAVSLGSRSGFPLAFEFRLPIKTSLLVAVPMATLATLCASLYFLPMLLCRLLFGVPFPLLPASMLLATLVIILVACAWGTTSTSSRSIAVIAAMVASLQLFAELDPVDLGNTGRPGPPRFNPDMVALAPLEYGLLAGIAVLLFGLAFASIRKQRYGEAPMLRLPGILSATQRSNTLSLAALSEWLRDLVALPCPVGSPWRAELWLELKCQVLPILVLGILVALGIPVLFALGMTPGATFSRFDYLFPITVFFAGIGIAIFNRRQATAGYMSAFEGTRGMSTLALALLQVLAIAGSILAGLVLACASLYFFSQNLDEPGMLATRLQALLSGTGTTLLLLSDAARYLVLYVSAVALCACVHTGSVVWGRFLPYGAGVLAIYSTFFIFRVQTGEAGLEQIKRHMWGFALMIAALTLLAVGRTLHLKLLSLRAGVAALLCWGFFLACSLYSMAQRDIVLANQAAELQAFNSALLLLPLMLLALLLWSYDRLRHR